jgi:type II secretory pathway pseudopilin PulG
MRKNFTMLELAIVIIILGMLLTVAIPVYFNAVEGAKATVCETNQKVIVGAIEAYTAETESFPGSLSKLRKQDIKKAWANILIKEGRWKIKLAYFLVNLEQRGSAHAQWIEGYLDKGKFFVCPATAGGETPGAGGGISYGINGELAGLSYAQYKALPSDTAIVGDCDATVFIGEGGLALRHKKLTLGGVVHYAIETVRDKSTVTTPSGMRGVGSGTTGTSPQEGEATGEGEEEGEEEGEGPKGKHKGWEGEEPKGKHKGWEGGEPKGEHKGWND